MYQSNSSTCKQQLFIPMNAIIIQTFDGMQWWTSIRIWDSNPTHKGSSAHNATIVPAAHVSFHVIIIIFIHHVQHILTLAITAGGCSGIHDFESVTTFTLQWYC